MLPEALGGGGLTDCLTGCLVQEELSHGCAGIGNLLTSNGFFAEPVLALGTPEQAERWVAPLCAPDPPLTALATTEPDSGSDAASIRTVARRSAGGYVLSGQKTWTSNGGLARFYVVFATVEPGSGHRGITAFVLHADDPGLTCGAPMRKMGQRAIRNTELFLEDVEIPADRRLGAEGEGFRGLMATFDRSRVTLAASATGLARAALEYATDYAKQRVQFGKPIAEHQAVAFRLADMALARGRRAPADLARRRPPRRRRARHDGGGDGQAARLGDRDVVHLGGRPDARRLGLLARVPRREVDARREAGGDRGGHLGHPAARHRPRAAALSACRASAPGSRRA